MEKLSAQDQQTYDAIFRHPTSGNIEWHALLALLRHVVDVVDEPNGKIKILSRDQTLTLTVSGKDVDMEAVKDVRRFLKEFEKPADEPLVGPDYLLVLDHTEARIYRLDDTQAKLTHIEPYDPHGWDKHVHDAHVTARRYTSALHHEFYEKIANVLESAQRILVFGDGKGSSQEFEHMLEDLKRHHPDFEKRLVGTVDLDLSHMTEGELVAKAREQLACPVAFVS